MVGMVGLAGIGLRGTLAAGALRVVSWRATKEVESNIPGHKKALINGQWTEDILLRVDGSYTIYWQNGGYTTVSGFSGTDKNGRSFTREPV